MQLEIHFTKDEILELYINLLPYGGNIQGIKAASFLYFGQTPQSLSLVLIVTFSIIPNDPNHLRFGIHNDRIVAKRNFWLKKLNKSGLFEKQQVSDALLTFFIPNDKKPRNSFRIWHAC